MPSILVPWLSQLKQQTVSRSIAHGPGTSPKGWGGGRPSPRARAAGFLQGGGQSPAQALGCGSPAGAPPPSVSSAPGHRLRP